MESFIDRFRRCTLWIEWKVGEEAGSSDRGSVTQSPVFGVGSHGREAGARAGKRWKKLG